MDTQGDIDYNPAPKSDFLSRTLDSARWQGSNIGHALSGAVELFDDEKRKRIILLCSDGGHVRPKNLKGILTDISTRGITIVLLSLGMWFERWCE